jgi:circadian clock protein KaiB
MYEFRLYLSGRTPLSRKAIEDLKGILDINLKNAYTLKILFVGENPHLDTEDNVVETPTAIRVAPAPTRRMTGDLGETESVLEALGLEVQE